MICAVLLNTSTIQEHLCSNVSPDPCNQRAHCIDQMPCTISDATGYTIHGCTCYLCVRARVRTLLASRVQVRLLVGARARLQWVTITPAHAHMHVGGCMSSADSPLAESDATRVADDHGILFRRPSARYQEDTNCISLY